MTVLSMNHFECEVLNVSIENVTVSSLHCCVLSASTRRELYNLGVIDILTNYGMKKKSAHVAKTKLSGSDADGISTVRPEIYARRFLEFIDKHFI